MREICGEAQTTVGACVRSVIGCWTHASTFVRSGSDCLPRRSNPLDPTVFEVHLAICADSELIGRRESEPSTLPAFLAVTDENGSVHGMRSPDRETEVDIAVLETVESTLTIWCSELPARGPTNSGGGAPVIGVLQTDCRRSRNSSGVSVT